VSLSSIVLAASEGGGGVAFPPIEHLVEWPSFLFEDSTWLGFNKIALINVIAVVLTSLIFLLSKKAMVPRGMQNLAESAIDFVDKGIIQQTIGHGGEKYLPYLASLFFFIFFGNIFEVVPGFHMPANARMANPAFLGVLTLVFFVAVGLKAQGPKYFWNAIAPPGVPKPMLPLVALIELISTFIVRPFSLAVRLFANLLAGHILLVTFGVLCITLFTASALALALPFSFAMLIGLTGFEIMVSFLQAYIFTILAAVYIGGAAHPEH
jgi:F-type H+-transporting ATPase subunit a